MEEMDIMEMRNQIDLLRKKLEKEQIITERMLKQTMKSRIGIIRRQAVKESISACVCFILFPALHYVCNLSWMFIIATLLLAICSIAATWYFQRPINEGLLTKDVRTVIHYVKQLKRRYQICIISTTPLIIPWAFWFWKEYTKAMNLPEEFSPHTLAVIVGSACIGLAIGLSWDRKVIHTCNELIDQLKE